MKNIYVVAHTESVHHVEKRVGGWYDTGLTKRGIVQAEQTATALQNMIKCDTPLIIASDLLRAKETAEHIGKSFSSEIKTSADLREISYGVAEGKSECWLEKRLTAAPNNNRLDHLSIEGGETKRAFIDRIYRAMDSIIQSPQSTHVVVTHGFALTFVVARWIGLPPEAAGWVNFHASHGGITHLVEDDFWQNRGVRTLNSTSHLSI